ncbi:SCO family protein [Microvirga sp. P5_D2]
MVAIVIVGAGTIALGWFQVERLGIRRDQPVVTATTVAAIGGPFSLVNHRGERVTQDTFKGKPTAYFFGFTHCRLESWLRSFAVLNRQSRLRN